MASRHAINQREHDRFHLQPMYTEVTVSSTSWDGQPRLLSGHAYDISESGIRFELDEPLARDEEIAMNIVLPGEPKAIGVLGQVVWMHDVVDDPGPRRIAVRFTEFSSPTDRTRLLQYLGSGMLRRVA